MKSANNTCPNCGRRLSINQHGFLDCTSCRQSPLATFAATAKTPTAVNLRSAPAGGSRNMWSAVRLFWPDLIALFAIAVCTVLLGEMIFDMIRRNL